MSAKVRLVATMRSPAILVGLGAILVAANTGCDLDSKCARAIIDSAGHAGLGIRREDCSKFLETNTAGASTLRTTVTAAAITVTVTQTSTAPSSTTTIPVAPIQKRAPAGCRSRKPIPTYATACGNAAEYGSACSCLLGVSTTVALATTSTFTTTPTVTITQTTTTTPIATVTATPESSCPVASTCSNQIPCSGLSEGQDCICFASADGSRNYCIEPKPCVACQFDSDCPAGDVCLSADTCCGFPTCGTLGSCPNNAVPAKLFRRTHRGMGRTRQRVGQTYRL
ncbi:hypothetical protein QBC47DRAFT_61261 [Echria macrotheca]|uniref:Uncharacterized protein n=1 Tax=Echria macrotheca TaxID=438768 RepID=A0AAJ0F8Y2_9PEZI|nr:hypothetical protein QBC47DRAFT_61261 [Echria macrotheca]